MCQNVGDAASYSPPKVLDSITVVRRSRLVDGLTLVDQRKTVLIGRGSDRKRYHSVLAERPRLLNTSTFASRFFRRLQRPQTPCVENRYCNIYRCHYTAGLPML